MPEPETATDLKAEVASLKQERAVLLEELESAYMQMEEHLLASRRERDIAYQELRERNRELQVRLEELERAHRELQEAQGMLVRSERLAAMGEMAAAIVHEIKNPLAVIIGQMTWILGQDGPPQRRGLERVLKAGEHLRGLVENVLGFARHHRGQARELDLNALVSDVEGFLTPVLRKAKVGVDLAEGLPVARCEPSQIEQVLVNLVLNARDATGGKGPIYLATGRGTVQEAAGAEARAGRPHTLAVEVDADAPDGDYVYAEVRDGGPGIDATHLEQIFEAFFTTKEEGKGTGLGLSIARTIVTEWGGNILAASRLGEGASFRVFLPVSEGAGPAREGEEQDADL